MAIPLLDYLGVDYAYLSDEYCCGAPHVELSRGPEETWKKVDKLCEGFNRDNENAARKLGAKRMIYLCQWCAYQALKYIPGSDIKHVYYLDVLVEGIEKLKQLKPSLPPQKVGYFEGCHERNIGFSPEVKIDWASYRQLVEIIDLPSWRCCVPAHAEIIDDARQKGVRQVVTPCEACWTWLEVEGVRKKDAPIMPVRMVQDILVDAIGERTFEGLYLDYPTKDRV